MIRFLLSKQGKYTFCFYLVIGLLSSSVGCIPPANWRPSPYLIARLTGSELRNKKELRIKLYEGKVLPVSSKNTFKFESQHRSKFHKGGDSSTPSDEGLYVAKNNILYFRGKYYHGQIKVEKSPHGFRYVNLVTMPHYVMSVIGHEMSNTWPLEALKAQAIVSRSYAVRRMMESMKKNYDMDTTTKYQVYGGILVQKEQLEKAVRSTQGKMLVYDSKLAEVFFHSSCGGRLEAPHELWRKKIMYLNVKESKFCQGSPNYRWQIHVSTSKVARLVGLTSIQKIKVSVRTASGRAKEILVNSRGKEIKLSPVKLRKLIGPSKLKSYFFDLRLRKGGKIELSGRGYGHGIGMCQWGSRFMVEKNKMRHQKILRHFFPGTSISKI